MSLRIWLPLRGSLENLGTDEVELTNNGATVSNQGKIGSCYNFGGSAYMVSTGTSLDIGIKSVCFWAYISNTGNYVLFTDYKSGLAFGVYSSYIPVSCSASNTTTYPKSLVELNQWNHFAIIKRESAIELWINGEKQTKGSNTDRWSSGITDKLAIGARPNGNDKLNGRLNDFRMYDHALSEKEIHDISKALVLHFPLDNNGGGGENLIKDSMFDAAPWSPAILDRVIFEGKYALIASNNILYSQTGAGKTSLFPGVVFEENTQYTFSMWYRDDYRTDGKDSSLYIRFKYSDNTTTNFITSKVSEWTYAKLTSTAGKTVIDMTTTYGNGGYLYLADLKLEKGTVATKWSPASEDNVVYDCSGFHNDGEIVDATSITATSDTVRYDASTYFDGVNSCIKIPYDASVWQTGFTFNIWFKKDDLGSKGYETLIGGSSGFEMDTRNGASTTSSLYMTSTRGGNVFSPFNLGEWYMITMVNDGTSELYYVNADLKKTITLKSMPTGQYYLGSWAGVNKQNYKGKMSDFRFYATALSADDIKELYEVGASVDNLQNIHAYLYEEDIGNLINVPDVYDKTTTAYFSQFSTDYDLIAGKTYYFSVEVETNEFPYYISIGYGENSYTRDIAYGYNQTENGLCTIIFTAPDASTLEANGSKFCFRAPRRNSSKTYTYSMINPRLTMIDSGIIPSIKKNGIVEANTFAEGDAWDAKVFESGDISAKELIEI